MRQLLDRIEGQFALRRLVELSPGQQLGLRKILERGLGCLHRQEIIKVDVGEGFPILVLLRLFLCQWSPSFLAYSSLNKASIAVLLL
jgi:hypothetical protein